MFLFTYGTLMDHVIMDQVAGDRFASVTGVLYDHIRKRVDQRVFPAIAPRAGFLVEGRMYSNVHQDAMNRLDRFEGELYQRTPVHVVIDDQSIVEAYAYIIRPEHEYLLSEDDWHLDNFKEKHRGHFKNVYEGFRQLD